MKVGILSDIHTDVNFREGNRVEDAIVRNIKSNAIDILVIAGDVSADYKYTLNVLNELEQKTSTKIVFVPGNHDIWNKNYSNKKTLDIYKQLQDFQGNLSRESIIVGDWAFVGDIGWYDYSFGANEYSIDEFSKGMGFHRQWQDKVFVNWGKSDIDMNEFFYNKLKEQLEMVKDKKIILVTHMVIHEAFIVPETREMWKYFNGFLGSNKYISLIEEYNIKYAIMGHVHYRRTKKIEDVEFICNCLNYRTQWYEKTDAFKEVDRAMYVIEI